MPAPHPAPAARPDPATADLAAPRKDDRLVTFPDVETTAQSPVNLTRTKRQLAEQAIAQATAAQWAEAAATNRKLLELGPDAEAENRLAKALWELGELGEAREHYQTALALDPTNRIAERNIDRLKMLLLRGRREDRPGPGGQQGAGQHLRRGDRQDRLRVPDRPRRRRKELAQVNPGDAVELTPEGNRLIAISNGVRIGVVEPRVAARLLKLIADGNKYAAGVTQPRRQGRPDHHPRGLPGPDATTARSASRPRPSRPTCARTPRAPSCARRWSSRRTSRTTRRTRRSRTSIASCRRSRRRDEAFEDEPDELDEP